MKTKILAILAFTTLLFADVPEHISFNSMVFDDSGNPVVNTTIAIKIEVLDIGGTALYAETNSSVTTDKKGLISLKIGTQTGTPPIDNFTALDFDEVKSIRISRDIDISDGIVYTEVVTEELSTAPFSFTCKELSGNNTSATGTNAQAWGYNTTASGDYSTASGYGSTASYYYSTAWGANTNASQLSSTAWGQETNSSGMLATAWGVNTNANGMLATTWGNSTDASGEQATAWGGDFSGGQKGGTSSGVASTAWGLETNATGMASTAWGFSTNASLDYATAWGYSTNASQSSSTAWGYYTNASGTVATAWGHDTNSTGMLATAWGNSTDASGEQATAWGGDFSGGQKGGTSSGVASTAWGLETNATGVAATAWGLNTVADQSYMTAIGKYNTTGNTNALFVVGNGSDIGLRNDAFAVMSTGDVYAGGAIVHSSDRRLKTNITPVENALQKIKAINGVNYNWIDPNKDQSLQMGVIAQEVQAVMPELINERNDGYLSVNYSGMNGVLIEAIKEQQVIIEHQQKSLDAKDAIINKILKALQTAGISIEE